MRRLRFRHGRSLTVSHARELLVHYVEFGCRPALFIRGQFDASILGGVRLLIVRDSSLGTIETQFRVFFVASSGVIDQFVPGIEVSLTLDHFALFGSLTMLSTQNSQNTGNSLLHCVPEDIHDRFALSP